MVFSSSFFMSCCVRLVPSVKQSLRSAVVIVLKISGPVSWHLLCCFAQLFLLHRSFVRTSLGVKAGAILTPVTSSHERIDSKSHVFHLLPLSFIIHSIFRGKFINGMVHTQVRAHTLVIVNGAVIFKSAL